MTSSIQDYALIRVDRSCALVATMGSIEFLCWPRFDSDACLAALLGDERHGYWRIAPAGYVLDVTRRYPTDSTILETENVTDTGRVRVLLEKSGRSAKWDYRTLIGNILKGLTHLRLINTALFLSGPVIQRAGG